MSLLSELEELQRCLEGNADSDTEEPSKHAESESSIGNETIHPVSITEEEFAEVENESNTVPSVSECEYTSLAEFIINEVDVSSKQEESKASREEILATVQDVPGDCQVLLTDAKDCNSGVKIQDVKSLAPSHGARAENATTRPELPVLKVGKLLADSDSLEVVTSKCDVSENVPLYEKDDMNSGLKRDLSNIVEDVLPASLQQKKVISQHLKLEGVTTVNSSAFRSKGMVKRSHKRSHSDTDTQKEREVTSEGEYMSDGIVTYMNTELQEESPPKKRKYTDGNMPGLRKRKAIFNVIMVKDNTSDAVLDEAPQMPNDIRPFIRKRKLPVHPISSDTNSSLLRTEDKFIPVGKPGPKRWKRKKLAGSYDSLVAESAGASDTSAPEEVEMLSTQKNGKSTGLVSDGCKKELMEARVVVKKLNIPIPEYLQSASSTRPLMLQETLAEVSKHIQESLILKPGVTKRPVGRPRITKRPVGRPRKVQTAAENKATKQKITGRPKQRVVVKRMQKQKIIAKPIQKQKLVGKAMQKRKIVGKAIQKQKIIGKLIQKQKIVGKQVQKQKIVGKQIQKQKVVGRPTQKQKIAGKPTQKQKIAVKPIQNQKVVGKSIQKQKIVGKSMQNQKTVGRPIQKQNIMGKAMQKQQNAGKLVQNKKVEKEGKTKPEIIRKLTAMQEIVGKLKQKQKIAKKSIKSLEEEMLGGTRTGVSAHQQGTSGLAEAILQRSMMRRALLPSITSRIGPKRKRTLSKKLLAFTINDLPGRKMQKVATVTQATKQVSSPTGLKSPTNSKIVQKHNKAASSDSKKTVSSPVAVKLNTKPSSVQKEKQSTSLDKRKRQIEDSVSKKGKKVVPPTAKRSTAPHPGSKANAESEEVPSYASGEEDEWIVEVLLDDDVNMMISDPEATVDFSRVSSSDERPQGVLANASDAHRVLECDSSTDTDKQKVAGKNLKNSVSARVSDPSSIPAKKKKTESVALPHSKNVSSSVSATTSIRKILPTEEKMLEMKKAISNLERVADRSMLRLKAEERQVIYLTNKLNEYENNKYHRNLKMILKDAEPGPRQSEHALFLLDLVLSYCPMEEELTYSESLATQTVGEIL